MCNKMRPLLFLVLISLFACNTPETEDTEIYDLEEKLKEVETKYNNEYIKIIDPDENEGRPKRAIHGNAAINQGETYIELDDTFFVKKINSYKKAYTSLHLSAKGVRMRMKDMYDFELNVGLSHDNVFGNVLGTYTPGEIGSKNFVAMVTFSDKIEDKIQTYHWKTGKLEFKNFSPGLGTIELHVSGIAEDDEKNARKLNLMVNMNFEDVHSSIRPKS